MYGCLGEIVISQGLFVSLLEDISQYMYVQGRLSFLKASLCLSLRTSRSTCMFRGDCHSSRPLCVSLYDVMMSMAML